MVDIKVGDWVKHNGWIEFYEVVKTEGKIITVLSGLGNRYSYSIDDFEFIIRDNPTPSPVREVVTKELVDGVYGRVDVKHLKDSINPVAINLLTRSQTKAESALGFNAKELRELAKTLNEVAEFLEGE